LIFSLRHLKIFLQDFAVSVEPLWKYPVSLVQLIMTQQAELKTGGFTFRLDLGALASDVVIRVLFLDADVVSSPQVRI